MRDDFVTSYPIDWPQRVLGNLCDIQIGGTPSRNVPRFWAEVGDGYPWVAISDLGPKWVYETAEHITAAGVANSNVKPVPKGTVLMSFKLTLGRVGIAGTDLYTNEAIAAFYPAADLDARWLYYSLPGIAKGGTAEQAIKGQTLNKDKLQRLPLWLPPLPEQRRIADILDTVDAAIQQTEALIAKLKLMKAGLLHDLLTRGLDEQGHLRDPIAHPEQFKDSPLGRIPRGWEVSTLDKVIAIFDCKHYTPKYTRTGIPIVRPRNVKVDGLDFSDIDYISEEEYRLLTDKHVPHFGDIVFSRNASFGVPCYVDTTQQFAIGQDVVIMTEFTANTHYIYYALISTFIEAQIQRMSAGSTFGRINLAAIRNLIVPVPAREEQDRITILLDAHDARLRAEEAYCDKLKQLKKGLMHDLLTGRVRAQAEAGA